MENVVVDVKNLSLSFNVSRYRTTSFKEYVMNSLRGRIDFQEINALTDINFQIQRGESVALIGHNGCGKSTLLKCIAGVFVPPNGSLSVTGRIAPMIELGAGFDRELSGAENIKLSCMLMGLSSEEVKTKTSEIIEYAELSDFIDIPLKNYSSGMHARLGFACATAINPDLLLVDEVLSVGDSNFARKCLDRVNQLISDGTTVILVSHDYNTVKSFCKRGIVLEKGRLCYDGPIQDAVQKQEEIMERRFLDGLDPQERSEILRLRDLEKTTKDHYLESIPRLSIFAQAVQDGSATSKVNLNRAFCFEFKVHVEHAERFDDDISIGIGINKIGGGRIGGYNNISHGLHIDRQDLAKQTHFSFRFCFDKGIYALATGDYAIVCGIHDRKITRSIFTGEVLHLRLHNQAFPINSDHDVMTLGTFVSDIQLSA